MSPIDDELRAALLRRATVVPPSPDPLAGIERRATRMRRNRVAASVAGSALAVAAVVTAVPLLTTPGSTGPDSARFASDGPSASTVPTPGPTAPSAPPTGGPTPGATGGSATSRYALDLDAPWPYRGAPLPRLGDGTVETIARELGVRHGVEASAVDLVPLWGQVDEPAQVAELAFAATVGGEQRWGYAVSSGAGPEFVVDRPLPVPALALAAALPGDEVPRLVVVASPEVSALEYGPDEASEFVAMTGLADGVATTPLEGDRATASYRALDASGSVLVRATVPALAGASGDPEVPAGAEPPVPTNVVDWPRRGAVPDDLRDRAVAAFAQEAGVPVEQVRVRLLFGAERDGRRFVLLQGWYGGDARAFAYSEDIADGTSAYALSDPTAPGPSLLAALLDDVLLVVPEPAAGQVLYAPDASSEPQAVADQGTEAAVLIDRPPTRTDDVLLVLDGDGDPERPLFRGSVEEALAASR